mgnify:CR=1 FL=1
MKNKFIAMVATLVLAFGPISNVNAQSSGASGGMSVGTAVAIGVVGAALLVALGDSSSSSAANAVAADDEVTGATTAPVTAVTTTSTTGTTN